MRSFVGFVGVANMVIRKGSRWAILTIRVRLLHEHLEHVVDPVLGMQVALALDTTNGNASRADLYMQAKTYQRQLLVVGNHPDNVRFEHCLGFAITGLPCCFVLILIVLIHAPCCATRMAAAYAPATITVVGACLLRGWV